MPRDLTTRMTLCRFKDFSPAKRRRILNGCSVWRSYLVAAAGGGAAAGAAPCAGWLAGAGGALAVVAAGWTAGLIQQACTRPVKVLRLSGTFGSNAPKRVRQRNAAWTWPPGQPKRSYRSR